MTAPLLALATAAALAAAPVPARRVAVLDFGASWAPECAVAAAPGQGPREQCEMLRLFADEARMGTLAVLRPPAFVVMTRENTAQILKDMGGTCAEGECEVETARLIGASVVVSGEVSQMEGTWIVSLKVHDVESAALLGGGRTEAPTKMEAFRNVRAETERMLKVAMGLGAVAPEGSAPARPAPAKASAPIPGGRWSLELRGAVAATKLDMTPAPAGPLALYGGGLEAGLRVHPQWRLLLGADAFKGTGPDAASGFGYDRALLVAFGAEWIPEGTSWLTFAARMGVGANTLTHRSMFGDASSLSIGPAWVVDLRAARDLGDAWRLGARCSLAMDTRDGTWNPAGGTVSGGPYLIGGLSLALVRVF